MSQPDISRFEQTVQRSWGNHVECNYIGWSFKIVNDTLEAIASPVYREIYGGEGDGSLTWAPFTYDVTTFGNEPGVVVEQVAVESMSQLCDRAPLLGIRGTFEGASFLLLIVLEPLSESKPKELLDTIHEELREIEDWER